MVRINTRFMKSQNRSGAQCLNFSRSFLGIQVPGWESYCDLTEPGSSPKFISLDQRLSARFAYRNATKAEFVLKYNVMPYVGVLTFGEAGRMDTKVGFPALSRR